MQNNSCCHCYFRQPPALFPPTVHWLLVDAFCNLFCCDFPLLHCTAVLPQAHGLLLQDKKVNTLDSVVKKFLPQTKKDIFNEYLS